MKKLWSNLDFKTDPITARFLAPALSIAIIISSTYAIVTKGFLVSAPSVFVGIYIICTYISHIQIKLSKKYSIFLLVYGIAVGFLAAYDIWHHEWFRGFTSAFLVISSLAVLKMLYVTKGETIEEEK